MLLRRHRIKGFSTQLEAIERGFQALKNSNNVPTPADMESLANMRVRLPLIVALCADLEPELWLRVETWRRTPYTPRQRRMRRMVAFLGWWLAGTVTIWQIVLGWLIPLFPASWVALPTSAAIAFIVLVIAACRGGLGEEAGRH